MQIKWSHEALEHLIEIEDYISKDSPARAIQFVDQLIEQAEGPTTHRQDRPRTRHTRHSRTDI